MERKILLYTEKVQSIIKGDSVWPVTCEIDPSNVCNLSCEFCMYKDMIKQDQNFLSFELCRNLLYELANNGIKSITFTGDGEPLMHPDFNRMSGLALDLGFKVGLITNGTRLDQIKQSLQFTFIRVSLDAHDSETYKKVKGKDYFSKVCHNIKNLTEQGVVVGLSYVVYQTNVHGIVEAKDLSKRLGASYIQFKPAWLGTGPFKDFEILEEKGIIRTDRYIAKDKIPCSIAGLIGIIGADGNYYFCCQYRGNSLFSLGDLKTEKISAIINSERRQRRMETIDLKECPQCRYMNYANQFYNFQNGSLISKHRHFL